MLTLTLQHTLLPREAQPLPQSVSILHELGEKFLLTLFRAKLIFKPTMPNEAKLATALRASCMHGQPQESDYASLNSCSDARHSYGSIKLLIRYRRRPSCSGSTALISYAPTAA